MGRLEMFSETRFLAEDGDFSVTKDGTGTFCLLALDVRYSNMSAVGLYFLPANLASAVEISFFSSSKSKSPSARVTHRSPRVVRLYQHRLLEIRDLR